MAIRKPVAASGQIFLGDLSVNRLGFGAMRITGEGIWGPPPDRAEARAVLRRVVELGVTLIDTADAYGPAVSEELIAEALWPYPENLVIATKGGQLRPGPGQWRREGHPEHLKAACDESLRRLRLERIPLYQLHGPDANVPIEDSIGALRELQEEGKILHIGVCNVNEAELDRALAIAAIVSVQNRYNLFDRRSDGLVDRCTRDGRAFLPWAPLDRGAVRDRMITHIAARHGATAHQVMLSWLLARSPIMLPIPGTGSAQHAEENCAAAEVRLSDEEIEALSALS